MAAIAVLAATAAARAADVGPGYDIEMSRMIPMRDGVELEAWISRPSRLRHKAPAILTLTQYDIDGGRHGGPPPFFARAGYAWVQVYVRGRGPLPAFFRDRVAYFMMGADEWRYAHTLEGASSGQELVLHLSSPEGTPQGIFHSGRLTTKSPGAEPPALMVSDPRELPELQVAKYDAHEGLTSQFRAYQKRAMVFHSQPFDRDTEIAGHIRLTLVCAADTPDFDLWAQVMMVQPDGTAVQLGQDIRRARFRDGFFKQELLKPGQTIEIPFEFNWGAWRIPAGARLRLVLAPLNSPNYQKNYNTGGRIGYENPADARVANVRIFHDGRRSSRLVLPLAAPLPAGGH
ncbi:MAG: CocE/NonD family hydrolase [Steroidobacteraceae bacterium]